MPRSSLVRRSCSFLRISTTEVMLDIQFSLFSLAQRTQSDSAQVSLQAKGKQGQTNSGVMYTKRKMDAPTLPSRTRPRRSRYCSIQQPRLALQPCGAWKHQMLPIVHVRIPLVREEPPRGSTSVSARGFALARHSLGHRPASHPPALLSAIERIANSSESSHSRTAITVRQEFCRLHLLFV